MSKTIFNTHYRLRHVIPDPGQEEIVNMPQFFAMSHEQITAHPKCPESLKRILHSFDWCGRPNYCQVRVQDFRVKRNYHDLYLLGLDWHVDINTPLYNGRRHVCSRLSEFRSMVCSWGDVVETEFARGPIEIDINRHSPYNHSAFAGHIASLKPETEAVACGQLATYTAFDAHRMRSDFRWGNARLIIVTVEQDNPLEEGAGGVAPSLKEKER